MLSVMARAQMTLRGRAGRESREGRDVNKLSVYAKDPITIFNVQQLDPGVLFHSAAILAYGLDCDIIRILHKDGIAAAFLKRGLFSSIDF